MQSPKGYTNRLIGESSPYLLQHAHNPVDWYPWGEEAFTRAKAEDKPLLVSIGYSACHWCHVMEHESFEDEETARVMNEHYINIKVDMEERPDVDQIYMNFVQITTGRGGWPMNVFLTPEKLPFFGGTYFPPQPKFGMPSFRQVLLSVAEAYRERKEELLISAVDILGELRRIGPTGDTAGELNYELSDLAFRSFRRSFDAVHGGFGGAPKFPPAMSMEFLLRYYFRTREETALEMVEHTCRKMAEGGIYDQLGGGFHRYSVDAVWLVPHFEKMLYDNAQLARVYLHLYQLTGGILYRRTAIEILEYVRREMLHPDGGFYSTQDADSEGEEGKFFVWTPAEIETLLGEDDARAFNFFYDVSEEGNFEGSNILHVRYTVEAAARALKMEPEELEGILERGRRRLFEGRERRVKPFRDEKVITAWNGLMLAAFAEAGAAFDVKEFVAIARRNADFLLTSVVNKDTGRLLRTWKDGTAKLNAYLEDHANLADGLIELYRATGERRYLLEARRIAQVMIDDFWDEENGGFFFTSKDHEELIVRNKDFYDNATPSGNSVAADVLLKLGRYFGSEGFGDRAEQVLRMAAGQARRHPQGFGRALAAIEFALSPSREIVIVGGTDNEFTRLVRTRYLPDAVVAPSEDPDQDGKEVPLIEGKKLPDGLPAAYVCENFACLRPFTDPNELAAALNTTQ
jgi:uncharacterized protein